ncbi:conserved Plasmodium protein, unknown function [Plasmodium gallinaceum]|uniref:Uncharacterized protein n=1 Tax=Plasmodium gallinaceum TaxID=5849 RepID=A0A1J1H131_PLAGA|nr:conserved Plasmodium protein, unknown function [Plasmodium gallinaceum]CRG96981.1 conserved Plasmodium protein, unknown function [Plasmodium gallinaceum]
MITSIDVIHELLTTIYYNIFSRNKSNINKFDILLYLDDYYYFDILKKVSEDIKDLDNSSIIIEKGDFNIIFNNFCTSRNYIIKDKNYSNDNEKRIDFLHEILSDLLCLLYKNKITKKKRVISKIYNSEKNEKWKILENHLISIAKLNNKNILKVSENNIEDILDINNESFKNENIIIQKKVNKDIEKILNTLINKYNAEYKLRFYYMFLNYNLTIQTMLMSHLINLYSKEVKDIIKNIINIKNERYEPINIYDVLSFQFDQIKFNKSSHDNLITPVKKIKIMRDIVERGGIPAEFSKKAILKDVINANYSLKEKYNKNRNQNENFSGKKYKVRNYYDSSRR